MHEALFEPYLIYSSLCVVLFYCDNWCWFLILMVLSCCISLFMNLACILGFLLDVGPVLVTVSNTIGVSIMFINE
jgi:hypothetical protein